VSVLEAHYETVRQRPGYAPVEVAVGDLSASYCDRRFAFTDDAASLGEATAADTVVSVGISMTGPPHVGTLGQIQSAIDFQRGGFDVQLVLADLVVHNARGIDIGTVNRRARRYRALAREMGFDTTRGQVQIQSEAPGVLRTGFLVATDYEPSATEDGRGREPTDFEAALDRAYEGVETPGRETTDFSGELADLLLVADTLHPLLEEGYRRVVLGVGADNVGLAGMIDGVRERAGVDGAVVGLYSRLVGGVDGMPKMSKGIPGSSLHAGMAPERIRERVTDPALDADRPARSLVYQMMRHVSPYSESRLAELREACAADTEEWREAVGKYAAYLADVARTWHRIVS